MSGVNWDDSAFVDIGHGVEITPLRYDGADVGLMERHWCSATNRQQRTYLPFADTRLWQPPGTSRWPVEQRDPLTLTGSVLCGSGCGKHGFIRDGRWVEA